jgi:hypothetical protein
VIDPTARSRSWRTFGPLAFGGNQISTASPCTVCASMTPCSFPMPRERAGTAAITPPLALLAASPWRATREGS